VIVTASQTRSNPESTTCENFRNASVSMNTNSVPSETQRARTAVVNSVKSHHF